jgi:hypothetical protein
VKPKVRYLLDQGAVPAAGVVAGRFSAGWAERVRGAFTTDQPGTLVLRWYNSATGDKTLEYTVPVCPDQTFASVYNFDVIRQGAYFEYEFTQGGVASTFLRAEIVALADA